MNKKKLRYRILAVSLALCFASSALPLSSSAAVSAAQFENHSIVGSGAEHVLSESNNYDISNELIMPGETFRIAPSFEITNSNGYYGQNVTNPHLRGASLELGDVSVISKLVRNTADVSGIEASIEDTYNVIKTAYDSGALSAALEQKPQDEELLADFQETLQAALSAETTATLGYVNNTNTPIVIQQVRTTSSKSEGVLYGGDSGIIPIVEANSTHKRDCTIRFYEPYYTLSYTGLQGNEGEGLPDRYYIQREKQELVLPNLVRPGYHFVGWAGLPFAEQKKDGSTTVLSFDWANNLLNASYNFGDETLSPDFEQGYTVTFNPNGGTIGGEKSAIYELDTEGEGFFDIGSYVPVREGYTFAGWCYRPSALYESLIEDTSNYDWIDKKPNYGYDIQLYAKWAEESDEEIEANGFSLNEETGELKILTDNGAYGWKALCDSTRFECKAKVKSIYIGGDVKSIDSDMFRDCDNLKTVVLSESVTNIGNSAFESCDSLETITIPAQINSIGMWAFYQCSQLREVRFEMTEYDSGDSFEVSATAFRECHPDLSIIVAQGMLDLFKETFMPAYADIITDSGSQDNYVINNVIINNSPAYCTVGEAPKAMATREGESALNYTFYEYWEEWTQTENGLEPVKFWYSDSEQMSRVPEDKKITVFEEGKTYSYSIIAQSNENYTFAAKDALSVTVNGKDFTAKSELILDGKSLMIGPGAFMTPTNPAEQKEIELIEISNASVRFKAGGKPVFTGIVPNDAPYVLDYEGWFGEDNEFICISDYWNSAYAERGWCDGLISSFKANTEYIYQLYVKVTDEAAAQGYVFGPGTQLKVNGKVVEYRHLTEASVSMQIGTDLTMTPAAGEQLSLGDVDGDNSITASDATLLLQRYADIISDATEGYYSDVADVNADGKVDSADATLVLQLYAGIITEF